MLEQPVYILNIVTKGLKGILVGTFYEVVNESSYPMGKEDENKPDYLDAFI